MEDENPKKSTTMEVATLKPIDVGKRRVGRPRCNWLTTTTDELWSKIGDEFNDEVKGTILNLDKRRI